jgi:hypothetical protein
MNCHIRFLKNEAAARPSEKGEESVPIKIIQPNQGAIKGNLDLPHAISPDAFRPVGAAPCRKHPGNPPADGLVSGYKISEISY